MREKERETFSIIVFCPLLVPTYLCFFGLKIQISILLIPVWVFSSYVVFSLRLLSLIG